MVLMVGSHQVVADSQMATPIASTPDATGDAPVAIAFPRDDGPHDAPIEWWYYTGHLTTEEGDRYGFEFVIFKGQRGPLTAYASHFALTDHRRRRFQYDQRIVLPTDPATPLPNGGFDLRVHEWSMRGTNGADQLLASMPGYAISLQATSEKAPVLHDGDGYIDYGNAGASYYYSRTRQVVEGTLTVDGQQSKVTGLAWMDHQWGDFATFDLGGWDWYALQLDDGWDVMLYVVNGPDGQPTITDGSLIAPDGSLRVLEGDDFSIEPSGTWTSSSTGVTYPSGWTITIPSADLVLTLQPTLLDQELDTRASTGQIYWEGDVSVGGIREGQDVTGVGYVELTGYFLGGDGSSASVDRSIN